MNEIEHSFHLDGLEPITIKSRQTRTPDFVGGSPQIEELSPSYEPPAQKTPEKNLPDEPVLQIDPKLASEKMRDLAVEGQSRAHSPALGSMLQTPRDTTPTQVEPGVPRQTYPPAITPDHVKKKEASPEQPNWHEVSQDQAKTQSTADAINNFLSQLPTATPPPPPPPKVTPPPAEALADSDLEELQKLKVYEAKMRADYRVKFSILREGYPQMQIPEPDEKQSIPEIEAMYKEYVKRIHIDSSVEQNKVYLLILWLLIEVVGCRLLRLPFNGYTLNQFKYMSKYQMLLIELGEKSYESTMGEGWPVEIRIGAMALFNGVIFILVQMLADKVGTSMAEELRDLISNFLTQNRGSDVLRRAAEASADNPPPPPAPQEAEPPLGNLGNVIAQLASVFTGGLGNTGNKQQTEQPQLRRPTTFASRRKRG